MERKIKVVQYGVGKMSVYTMRYALEKGCEIVGAVDINPEIIGKDISVVLGGNPTGVVVTSVNEAEAMLREVKPDICIVTTMSLFNDVYAALELCAKLGINAITTCEEAFFPMNSILYLQKQLIQLQKKLVVQLLVVDTKIFTGENLLVLLHLLLKELLKLKEALVIM